MNTKKFTEKSKEEMPISSQVTLNDDNWLIIKKFRIVDIDTNKIKYTFLAKCKKCGYEKEVSNSGIYKGLIWCPQCSALEEVGKIYGKYKILKFVDRNDKDRSYQVQCIKCNHIFDRKRLGDIRKATDHCQFCNVMEDNPGLNKIYTEYKTGAKNRNLQFNLSKEQFLKIVHKDCAYCGQPPKYREIKLKNKVCNININGIDRIDSTKGYSLENCNPCCSMCNTMKLNYTLDEFKSHVSKIYHFLVKGSTTIPNGSTLEAPSGNGEIPPT